MTEPVAVLRYKETQTHSDICNICLIVVGLVHIHEHENIFKPGPALGRFSDRSPRAMGRYEVLLVAVTAVAAAVVAARAGTPPSGALGLSIEACFLLPPAEVDTGWFGSEVVPELVGSIAIAAATAATAAAAAARADDMAGVCVVFVVITPPSGADDVLGSAAALPVGTSVPVPDNTRESEVVLCRERQFDSIFSFKNRATSAVMFMEFTILMAS